MSTQAESVHPLASVTNTQYVVVTVGLTTGFEREDVNPEGADVHEYAAPPEALRMAEPPAETISTLAVAVAVGPLEFVTAVVNV